MAADKSVGYENCANWTGCRPTAYKYTGVSPLDQSKDVHTILLVVDSSQITYSYK